MHSISIHLYNLLPSIKLYLHIPYLIPSLPLSPILQDNLQYYRQARYICWCVGRKNSTVPSYRVSLLLFGSKQEGPAAVPRHGVHPRGIFRVEQRQPLRRLRDGSVWQGGGGDCQLSAWSTW